MSFFKITLFKFCWYCQGAQGSTTFRGFIYFINNLFSGSHFKDSLLTVTYHVWGKTEHITCVPTGGGIRACTPIASLVAKPSQKGGTLLLPLIKSRMTFPTVYEQGVVAWTIPSLPRAFLFEILCRACQRWAGAMLPTCMVDNFFGPLEMQWCKSGDAMVQTAKMKGWEWW